MSYYVIHSVTMGWKCLVNFDLGSTNVKLASLPLGGFIIGGWCIVRRYASYEVGPQDSMGKWEYWLCRRGQVWKYSSTVGHVPIGSAVYFIFHCLLCTTISCYTLHEIILGHRTSIHYWYILAPFFHSCQINVLWSWSVSACYQAQTFMSSGFPGSVLGRKCVGCQISLT